MSEKLLEIRNLSKSFGQNQVLFDVDFTLLMGEVHAIIGENGAGKSTMMNIVDGLVQPDGGEILIEGKPVKITNPLDAQQHGICFVHQEIALCQDVSVAQNIFMAQINSSKKAGMNYRELAKSAAEILKRLDSGNIDPNSPVSRLSISNQQIVEIAKALSIECKVLILDEPTAALTETETEALYNIMGQLKRQGIGIVYISHRMSEIFEQCDRVSVLRDGHMVSQYNVKDVQVQQLVNDMAGREVDTIYPAKAGQINYSDDNILLEVNNLTDANDYFKDVSFKLYKGEMLGFSGLIGSGRSEIMQGVVGLRRIKSGEVLFDGKNVAGSPPKDIFSKGLLYMSEDRKQSGLFLDMSLMMNISAMHLEQITDNGFINSHKERGQATKMTKELNIRATSINQLIMDLSGGNQQKALIAKLLAKNPDVVILDEPTRGIDVAAKAEIHKLLRRLVEQGIGVIVISSELNEVIGICDRVAIINEGRIVCEVSGQEIESSNIMYFASGAYKIDQNKEEGGNAS